MLFETRRCRIRAFAPEDIDAFAAYRNNETWMRYQGFKGRAREEYAQALLAAPDFRAGVQLAIADRQTDQLLGDLYVRQDGFSFWIGYTLAPALAGQGIAREAVRGLLRWLRAQGAQQALAAVTPENEASIRLLGKLGFARTGVNEEGEACYSIPLDTWEDAGVDGAQIYF